jgi:membrane-associated phospholipid phosphatase
MYIIEKCIDPGLLADNTIHVMVLLTHSLPMLVFAGMCYAVWWATLPSASGLHSLAVTMLVIINVAINHVLKMLIGWPRLHPTCDVGHLLKVGSSFPSAHASVVVCLSVYYTYCFYHFTGDWSVWQRYTRILIVNVYGAGVCVSRIYLELNQLQDIVVGSIVGTLLSFAFISLFLGDTDPQIVNKMWKND